MLNEQLEPTRTHCSSKQRGLRSTTAPTAASARTAWHVAQHGAAGPCCRAWRAGGRLCCSCEPASSSCSAGCTACIRSVAAMSPCPNVSQAGIYTDVCSYDLCVWLRRSTGGDRRRPYAATARRPLALHALPSSHPEQAAEQTLRSWQSTPVMHQSTEPTCRRYSHACAAHEASLRHVGLDTALEATQASSGRN